MTTPPAPPPRTAELLLETLGAAPELRDAIVGDLAEEYAWLVDATTVRDARRWYWREALRAVPHLLRSSMRAATWGDVRRRAGIVLSAFAIGYVFMKIGGLGIHLAWRAPWTVESMPAIIAVSRAVWTAATLGAGYVAARIDERTPLLSAMSLALLFMSVDAVTPVILSGGAISIVSGLVASLDVAPFVVLGGWLRLRQLSRRVPGST
ncbi:MAG TPA: permease prefix domain 2-containing transporter [Gemmatimonadaceae bacterium]|nr:permease prefix domain 2-containing transporter [Gemmatimonadaceae bacterium]